MLSNKYFKIIIFLSTVFLITSCDKDEALPRIDYDNKNQLKELSQRVHEENVVAAFGGFFDDSPRRKIASVVELDGMTGWGIKFSLIEEIEGKLQKVYESEILSGSKNDSFLDKIKFPTYDYELLYYNSQAYFMGSGGGEIFAYIINFEDRQTYYAHLIVETKKPVSLYVSDNIPSKDIRNFLIQIFKKDYPGLKLIVQDISLD